MDYWVDFSLLFFSKEKGPPKNTKKARAKFIWKFVRKNSLRFLQNRLILIQQGPGEEGPAGYCPKILLQNRAKMVLCPSIGVIGKSALEIGSF